MPQNIFKIHLKLSVNGTKANSQARPVDCPRRGSATGYESRRIQISSIQPIRLRTAAITDAS